MTHPSLDEPLSAIAAMAAQPGSPGAAQLLALARALAVLEERRETLDPMRATRLALDLHEIHARLEASPERSRLAERSDVGELRERMAALRNALNASSDARFTVDRARLRAGELRGRALVAWLVAHPPEQREMAVEHLFGIAYRPLGKRAMHPDLVDYIPSGIAPVVRAVTQVPITSDDVFVDLGSGLGKVAMAVRLLSGARVRGIELQPELVEAAELCARALGVSGISYETGDARFVDLSGATVIFMYLPFTGETLAAVMRRVEAAARQRSLVICTLGVDLRAYDWLVERETNELWLAVYDSQMPGVPPRRERRAQLCGAAVEAVASESTLSGDRHADDETAVP